MIVPVILAGGAGTRLWPLSRQLHPKQVLPITGQATMIQETLGRLEGLDGLAPPIVICNESHRFMIAEQLREKGIQPGAIVLEPVGRNTAPAIAVAACKHPVRIRIRSCWFCRPTTISAGRTGSAVGSRRGRRWPRPAAW